MMQRRLFFPGLFLAVTLLAGTGAPALAADPEPRLRGTVVDDNGAPIYQADLDFYEPGTRNRIDPTPPGRAPDSDKTGLDGRYSMKVSPAIYDIRYQPPLGRSDLATIVVEGFHITADTTLDVRLPRGYVVTGLVTTRSGAPVEGVDIDVLDPLTGKHLPTPGDKTGSGGAYRVIIVPGTYTFTFTPPSGARLGSTVLPRVVVTRATRLDATLPPGFFLSGRLLEPDGAAVTDADLDVDDSVTGERIRTPGDGTDSNGRFQIVVPGGPFDLILNPPPGRELAAGIQRQITLAGDRDLGDLRFESGTTLSAVILGPDGLPLANARALFHEGATGLRYPAPGATSDANGRLGVRLPHGTWIVRIAPPVGAAFDTLDVGTLELDGPEEAIWQFETGEFRHLTLQIINGTTPIPGTIELWRSPRGGKPLLTLLAGGEELTNLTISTGRYDLVARAGSNFLPDSMTITDVAIVADTTISFDFHDRTSPPPPHSMVALTRPAPSPFTSTMRVTAMAAEGTRGTLFVFDVSGRLVRRFPLEFTGSSQDVVWDGRDAGGAAAPAGVYFLRLFTPTAVAVGRVVKRP